MPTYRSLVAGGLIVSALLLLSAQVSRPEPANAAQFRSLADRGVWHHAWARDGKAVTLAAIPGGETFYLTGLQIGVCADSCAMATILVDDKPVAVFTARQNVAPSPLRIRGGQTVSCVVNGGDVSVTATGYRWTD